MVAELSGCVLGEICQTVGMSGQADSNKKAVILATKKSAFLAFLLGLIFGPIGMIYSAPWGALFMFLVNSVVGFLTAGLGLFITWPICGFWAAFAAMSYNARVRRSLG